MFASETNFELLTSILVLLRPFGVVFPRMQTRVSETVSGCLNCEDGRNVLEDLAVLDDTLDLLDHGGADAHYGSRVSSRVE